MSEILKNYRATGLTTFASEKEDLKQDLQKLPNAEADDTYATRIFNEAYALAGLIAVIVIIIGAIQYITSSGDPSKATKAKNMILYAVIGLIIVLLAAVITNFVIGAVS